MHIGQDTFVKHWEQTEIIRTYQPRLFADGDAVMPYIFVAEHPQFRDKVVAAKGVLHVSDPVLKILNIGPQFEGFDLPEMPGSLVFFIAHALNYCRVNKQGRRITTVEHKSLSQVIEEYDRRMDEAEDDKTGLIKGAPGGMDVGVCRYFLDKFMSDAPEKLMNEYRRALNPRAFFGLSDLN